MVSSELNQVAQTSVDVDEELAEKVIRLIDMLEDCDDVQQVHQCIASDEDIV